MPAAHEVRTYASWPSRGSCASGGTCASSASCASCDQASHLCQSRQVACQCARVRACVRAGTPAFPESNTYGFVVIALHGGRAVHFMRRSDSEVGFIKAFLQQDRRSAECTYVGWSPARQAISRMYVRTFAKCMLVHTFTCVRTYVNTHRAWRSAL